MIARILGTALIILAGAASAQNIEKFVVTGDAAKHALTKTEISADTAAKITQACIDYAVEHKTAVSVFILSPSGNIVHAHRMDGQLPINIETALLKAKSVLFTRDSTHARANPTAIAATSGRVLSKVFMAVMKPSFVTYFSSPPRRFSSGTRQSSRTSSAVSLARRPILSSMRPMAKPGVPFSTTKARCPARPSEGSIVAKMTVHDARPPFVM